MPNLAQSLKAEIQRISRKEVKTALAPLHASNVALKKNVADLKKRASQLEADIKRRGVQQKPDLTTQTELSSGEAPKARITGKSVRALREKLGLSQEAFGNLIGVSSQNVYVMEHKEGRLTMREKTLANYLAIKGMGRREAKKRLSAMEQK